MDIRFYIIIFCLSFFVIFYTLQSSRLPELFKKNKVAQIQASYIIISFICGYLMAEGIFKIMDVLLNNLK